MKIGLSARIYKRNGGISRYVTELAEHFAKDNDVHIFASEWESEIGTMHKVSVPHNNVFVESAVYFAKMSMVKNDFDVLHTNGLETLFPDVVTAHSIHKAAMKAYSSGGLGVMDKWLLTIEDLNYRKYRKYRKIIAVSQSSKDELMEFYGVPDEDIEVVPLGVDLMEFPVVERRSTDCPTLMIVATEFYRKGVVELIKACGELKRRGNRFKLVVVGEPRNEGDRVGNSWYRELVKKEDAPVFFMGKVDGVNSWYQLADIFVFPTKYEAFGLTLLEAMASGLPVVCSKVGAGGLVTDGKDGLVLKDCNDVMEIANEVEMLLEDENMRKEMGKNARKTAERYTWDETARRTMEIYESL